MALSDTLLLVALQCGEHGGDDALRPEPAHGGAHRSQLRPGARLAAGFQHLGGGCGVRGLGLQQGERDHRQSSSGVSAHMMYGSTLTVTLVL